MELNEALQILEEWVETNKMMMKLVGSAIGEGEYFKEIYRAMETVVKEFKREELE